ncbi:hypothetical protein GCM10010218_39230 [Streptomyces mashuensis]|uniref:Uncharacterized protein n=1 Tax=Streptomyces mashuensis TaxID=33904 RepID=A0A919EE61_9ACTN|nr:hypothetical protein GCM10010218_39230 [Streptomyces mashuensis]
MIRARNKPADSLPPWLPSRPSFPGRCRRKGAELIEGACRTALDEENEKGRIPEAGILVGEVFGIQEAACGGGVRIRRAGVPAQWGHDGH